MTQEKILLKSEGRPNFKIGFLIFIGAIFFITGIVNENTISLLLSGILAIVIIIESITYSQTTLTLTKSEFIIDRTSFFNSNNDSFKIELNDIQSAFYKKMTHDNWALLFRPLWEFFFPSGESFLIINKLNGKTKKIPFNGNEKELLEFMSNLPERIPNT